MLLVDCKHNFDRIFDSAQLAKLTDEEEKFIYTNKIMGSKIFKI